MLMKKLWERYSYVIILIAISYAAIFTVIHKLDKTDEFINVTVQQGESLWEIADKFSDRHTMSNAEFVSWVKAENGIEEDAIHPGDSLVIPVEGTEFEPDVTVLAGE